MGTAGNFRGVLHDSWGRASVSPGAVWGGCWCRGPGVTWPGSRDPRQRPEIGEPGDCSRPHLPGLRVPGGQTLLPLPQPLHGAGPASLRDHQGLHWQGPAVLQVWLQPDPRDLQHDGAERRRLRGQLQSDLLRERPVQRCWAPPGRRAPPALWAGSPAGVVAAEIAPGPALTSTPSLLHAFPSRGRLATRVSSRLHSTPSSRLFSGLLPPGLLPSPWSSLSHK